MRVALALAATLLAATLAGAAERVLVLVGGKGRAFDDAVEGVRAEIERGLPGVGVEALAIERDAPAPSVPHASAYVALGDSALRLALDAELRPFVAGLIVKTDGIPRDRGTAVSLEFSPRTQLAWIREVLPSARHLGVLYNPDQYADRIEEAKREAKLLGLTLSAFEVRARSDLMPAMRVLANRVDALWALPDSTVYSVSTVEPILTQAYSNRLPVIGLSAAWVNAGAFAAPERDYVDIGRQCGEQVVRLLRGADPSALPMQLPRAFLYTLNRRSADYLRLTLPPAAARNAAHVVE
jgi:putative ABC transport system substrate-binding protein